MTDVCVFEALHQAAMFDQTEVIECLKDLGGVIDATDYHGSTPLHIACQRGNQSATVSLHSIFTSPIVTAVPHWVLLCLSF